MDRWRDKRTDRGLGCSLGEEPRVTLTLLFSRQWLPGMPDQWQLGRPRELLGVPGDPQRGGEASHKAARLRGGSGTQKLMLGHALGDGADVMSWVLT